MKRRGKDGREEGKARKIGTEGGRGKGGRMEGEHMEEGKDWEGGWNECKERGREGIEGGREAFCFRKHSTKEVVRLLLHT